MRQNEYDIMLRRKKNKAYKRFFCSFVLLAFYIIGHDDALFNVIFLFLFCRYSAVRSLHRDFSDGTERAEKYFIFLRFFLKKKKKQFTSMTTRLQ